MDRHRKLQDSFKLEKSDLSYADFHSEVVKNLEIMTSSSGRQLKQNIGGKVCESEEIVKYMSSLPNYLESGSKFHDKALTFGVMDWGRLEEWQYTRKQPPVRSRKDFPSTSNSSSFFSPAIQKSHRTTLQSHFTASPHQSVTPCAKLPDGSSGKFQDIKDVPEKNMTRQYEAFHKSHMEARLKECSDIPGMTSSSKGKMKIQENELSKGLEKNKNVVLLLPRDGPDKHTNDERLKEALSVNSKKETNFIDRKSFSANIQANPGTSKNQEKDNLTMSLEGSDPKMASVAPSKVRSVSPLRRLSISMRKIGRNSISRDSLTTPQLTSKSVTSEFASERPKSSSCSDNSINEHLTISSKSRSSPPRRFSSSSRNSLDVSQSRSNLATSKPEASDSFPNDNSNVTSRARSSPLRRLLDPLFAPKEDSKIKVKAKLDFGSNIDHSHRIERKRPETMQALFQIAVKSGRPLFTFAVENNSDVLAATVRRLSSPMKDGSRWIYTFFTVQEVKKKNTSWLNPGTKGKGHGYVPNIVGQMKVSDVSFPNREFVLFSVNLRPSDQQILDVHPRDELAAIVVKFPSKATQEDGEGHFSTEVILPGGHHGLPSKGEPSPLIERWRSGGLCDCGGWDMGCRMRVLANQNHISRKSNSSRIHLPIYQFELFSEGENVNEGPFFSMSPLKENIYSVEFNSSMTLLQAFSTCISVAECRKSSLLFSESREFMEEKLSIETTEMKLEEVPVRYASYPPVSPVGRV